MAEAEWTRSQQGLEVVYPRLAFHSSAQWLLAAVELHSLEACLLAAALTDNAGIRWNSAHTHTWIPKVKGSVGKSRHTCVRPDFRGPEEAGPTFCLGGPWDGPFHIPKHLMLRTEAGDP